MAGTDTRTSTPTPPAPAGPRGGEAPAVILSPDAAAIADDIFGGVETAVIDAREAQRIEAQGKLLEAQEVAGRIDALLNSIRTPKQGEGPDAINHYAGVVLDLRVELGEPRELPATLSTEVTDTLGLQAKYADAVATLARNKDALGEKTFAEQSAKIEGGHREKIAPKVEAAIRILKRYAEDDLLPRRRAQQDGIVAAAAARTAELAGEDAPSFARVEIVQAPETMETAKRRLQRVVECAVGVPSIMASGNKELAHVRDAGEAGRIDRGTREHKEHWVKRMATARYAAETATDAIFEALRRAHKSDEEVMRICNVEPLITGQRAESMREDAENPYVSIIFRGDSMDKKAVEVKKNASRHVKI